MWKTSRRSTATLPAPAAQTSRSTVEDAVRLGADADGYTVYVGSARQDEDLAQFRGVRGDCDRYGMPLVVWVYPRGAAVDARGGQDSFYPVDYAARVAAEIGADIVKVNFPDPSARSAGARPVRPGNGYRRGGCRCGAAGGPLPGARLGRGAGFGRGGAHPGEEAMAGGATGVIFGRNVWQREHDEAMRFVAALRDVLCRQRG